MTNISSPKNLGLHTGSGEKRTVSAGVAAPGWVINGDGFAEKEKTPAENEVGANLYYETPQQIEDREHQELRAEQAAEEKAAQLRLLQQHQITQNILAERSTSGTRPTLRELRLIGCGVTTEARYAQAALLAAEAKRLHPDAEYIAFEASVNEYADPIRTAVFLDANLHRLGEQKSFSAPDDYYLEEEAVRNRNSNRTFERPSGDDQTMEDLISDVFPMTETDDEDGLGFTGDEHMRSRMIVTEEARSFDDGTHMNIPNLFTISAAEQWVPEPGNYIWKAVPKTLTEAEAVNSMSAHASAEPKPRSFFRRLLGR